MQNLGYMMKNMNDDVVPNPDVLKANQRMVDQLGRARRKEKSKTRRERTIDYCAEFFLILCGYADSPFSITAQGDNFKIFGKTCRGIGDRYVVVTPSNDLVLVFEDNSLEEGKVIGKQGHLGQIVAELLKLLSMNGDTKTFRSVLAVRLVNYHVTAFRVDPSLETLSTLCDTDKVPTTKLELMCNVATPGTSLGLSLIDPTQRLTALRTMADMRQFIRKQ